MKIVILSDAEADLVESCEFYERQEPGLGAYFRDCIASEITSLATTAGLHARPIKGYFRALARRHFTNHAIFYLVVDGVVEVHMVFDCRRHPRRLLNRLEPRL
jgi:hypothetical protein